MEKQVIKCPNCGTEIPIDEALTEQLLSQEREILQKEYRDKIDKVDKEKKKLDKEKKELNEQIENGISEAIKKKEKEFEAKHKQLDREYENKIKAEREKLEKAAKEKAKEEIALQMKDIEEHNNEKDKKN